MSVLKDIKYKLLVDQKRLEITWLFYLLAMSSEIMMLLFTKEMKSNGSNSKLKSFLIGLLIHLLLISKKTGKKMLRFGMWWDKSYANFIMIMMG